MRLSQDNTASLKSGDPAGTLLFVVIVMSGVHTHVSEARHLGDSQALRIVLSTSSRDGPDVSTAPTVDREHRYYNDPAANDLIGVETTCWPTEESVFDPRQSQEIISSPQR
jgi:hypothetical protein